MKGENDQMSSCSGATRRNCPARIPASTFNGKLAHSPCITAGSDISAPPDAARQASADHAQQQRGFEREVAGEEAFDVAAYPDAECDGNRHPQRQINLVPGFAAARGRSGS